MSEATPDVLSPMCWNVWTPAGELASRMAWHELGLLPRSEVRLPDNANQFVIAPFFGRQAINVDRLRTLMGGLPGTSPEDVDRQFLGMVRTDAPPVPRQWARVPIMAVKAPFVIATQTTAVRLALDGARAATAAGVRNWPPRAGSTTRPTPSISRFRSSSTATRPKPGSSAPTAGPAGPAGTSTAPWSCR